MNKNIIYLIHDQKILKMELLKKKNVLYNTHNE